MQNSGFQKNICIIIGASHAGVNCAFSLRKEGWKGKIILIDKDQNLPYHRPPLSKTYLTNKEQIEDIALKPIEAYTKENINLRLGEEVKDIDGINKRITLQNKEILPYTKLVLAVGARAVLPPIKNINAISNLFTLRTAKDVEGIAKAISQSEQKRVIIIGGGYIGLETAASLKKLGANITLLEREERILARVTTPEMSAFFKSLHSENGVKICTGKNVTAINQETNAKIISCSDGTNYHADLIIVGVGVIVNTALGSQIGLEIKNGIKVNHKTQTSNPNIYAIGDCSYHHNLNYNRYLRLESVQNALDQAKIAAANICNKEMSYDTIPWFWSDQYDVKLQIVGLNTGYTQALTRREIGETKKFSIWYFKQDTLLGVDAINNAKAYVIGTKFIKTGVIVDKSKLIDPTIAFKPAHLIKN